MNILTHSVKVDKGHKLNVLTGIIYMMPATSSNIKWDSLTTEQRKIAKLLGIAPKEGLVNTCLGHSEECFKGCLRWSGMLRMPVQVNAGNNKTTMLITQYDMYMIKLAKEILSLEKKAKLKGMTPAIRLNGTTDLFWENTGIIDKFPNIQFYDYTKIDISKRFKKGIPSNYHITYSFSGHNWDKCLEALKQGVNVAVPFDVKKKESLPNTFKDIEVIDGDISDARFLDKKGVIVGLRVKGSLRKTDTNRVFLQG